MILQANAFVEGVLPRGILRKLSDEEMAAYRAPFPDAKSRRPVLALPRDLPIEGEPADVDAALQSAHAALAASSYPKLLFVGDPGALVTPAFAADFAASLEPCALVRLGAGLHFLQEDHADAIGRSVAGWIAGIEAASQRRRQAA
jgi:haloalkane dehalogenase